MIESRVTLATIDAAATDAQRITIYHCRLRNAAASDPTLPVDQDMSRPQG
jgi:hypothetical protein